MRRAWVVVIVAGAAGLLARPGPVNARQTAVGADLGFASAVGMAGVTLTREILDHARVEVGGGYGYSGTQRKSNNAFAVQRARPETIPPPTAHPDRSSRTWCPPPSRGAPPSVDAPASPLPASTEAAQTAADHSPMSASRWHVTAQSVRT